MFRIDFSFEIIHYFLVFLYYEIFTELGKLCRYESSSGNLYIVRW